MTNRTKYIGKISLQILLIFLFTVVLLEITLGIVFEIKDRNLIEAETYDYPYLYFKLLEDNAYRNDDGLKILAPKEKSDSTYRIIITGGSVTYGLEYENTISANLEEILQDSFPNKKIEVLNAGVPAYVIEQEFILIQLVLQYYEPNMIISLDGYNDLITTEINRFYPCPDILPPHNWKDFSPIKEQSFSRKIRGRFFGIFPNIERLADFFNRKFYADKNNFQELKNNKEIIALTYSRRVKDIEAFCRGKEITYFNILQPLAFIDNPKNDREETLAMVYKCMSDSLKACYYYTDFSTTLVDNKNLFIDECHINTSGNKLIAKQIADMIFPTLREKLFPEKEILVD
ncbi:MAG: hypothetical protein PHW83_04805 [Bacteroidales bacterium]|nr:hypothetical protein [Bacteroidales bacterium]